MWLIFYNDASESQEYQWFATFAPICSTKSCQKNNDIVRFFYPQWTKKNGYLKQAARFLLNAQLEC